MKIKSLIIALIFSCSFGSLMAQESTRSLPAIPNGKGEFHAYYTRLNYSKEWENFGGMDKSRDNQSNSCSNYSMTVMI
jgi:hypothetical protein